MGFEPMGSRWNTGFLVNYILKFPGLRRGPGLATPANNNTRGIIEIYHLQAIVIAKRRSYTKKIRFVPLPFQLNLNAYAIRNFNTHNLTHSPTVSLNVYKPLMDTRLPFFPRGLAITRR